MPPIIGTAEHQLCAPSGVGGAVSRRGVSRQYTWVLLGELPPSSGGCRPPTLPALGLILPGSKQLHLPVGLQPPQIPHGGWGSHGGGVGCRTAHRGGAGAPSRGHSPGAEQGPGCPPGTHGWGGCRTCGFLQPSHPRGCSMQCGQAPRAGILAPPCLPGPIWVLWEDEEWDSPLKKHSSNFWKEKGCSPPCLSFSTLHGAKLQGSPWGTRSHRDLSREGDHHQWRRGRGLAAPNWQSPLTQVGGTTNLMQDKTGDPRCLGIWRGAE